MVPTTEFYLRLYIFEFLHRKASDFKQLYEEISIPELANYLKRATIQKYIPLSINAQTDLMLVA